CGGAAAPRAHWRSLRKCTAPRIPIRRRASTTSRACFRPRAIAIGEKTLGCGYLLTPRYKSNYARLLLDTGRSAEALSLAQSALATHETASGSRDGRSARRAWPRRRG